MATFRLIHNSSGGDQWVSDANDPYSDPITSTNTQVIGGMEHMPGTTSGPIDVTTTTTKKTGTTDTSGTGGGATGGGTGGSGGGGTGSGGTGGTGTGTDTGFSDSIMKFLSGLAMGLYGNRMNPPANSGTSIYEDYAKQLIGQLQQPPFSSSQMQAMKANAYDSVEQDRNATKQRWMEMVGQRGFLPSSGVALDGVKQIDNHYDQLRAQMDRGFTTDEAQMTRQDQMNALSVASQLASEESNRLNQGFQYATVPYGLQNNALSQLQQVVAMGGNPMSAISQLIGLGNAGMNANQLNAQNTAGMMQYLGYLFGM